VTLHRPARIGRAAGVILIAVGVMVLLGWTFDIHVLKAVFGPITMKANAAVGLLMAGVALVLLDARPPAAVAGTACATFVGTLGAATLSQHLFGWNLGIDQLLFTEIPGAAATTSPGRMGPNASTSLTLSGIALACLHRATLRSIFWAQILGAIVVVLALIPTIGYLYGAAELYAIARYTGIAMHTGLALLVLGGGILAARPHCGPAAALVGDAPHVVVARRLMVVALLAPILLGYLRVMGERRGWFDAGLGVSLVVVAMIILLSLTIWRAAVALAHTHAELARAERERLDLLERERAARHDAERADRAKDEFIAALSHELRTPLNAILGWMYMLRQDALPSDARGKAAEAVVRNADLLSRLIEDLLDTSRITTGRLALARASTDLAAVVGSAIESVLPASEARDVRVRFDRTAGLPPVDGDAQRLQQVVWNLLSNAIKFSSPGGTVTVTLAPEARDLVLTVQDEGIGIDPAFLPQVFDRFQQADSSQARGHGGLGLGLYIARHLVSLHDGTLEAHSDGAGAGARFVMRLPAVFDTAPRDAAAPAAPAPLSGIEPV